MEAFNPDDWVGRTQSRSDQFHSAHVRKIAATFDHPAPEDGQELPWPVSYTHLTLPTTF